MYAVILAMVLFLDGYFSTHFVNKNPKKRMRFQLFDDSKNEDWQMVYFQIDDFLIRRLH